jgi:hypothetical protein
MANLKRDNHYLPECYQKGFADSSGRVWVKLANKLKPEPRRPRSVGRRRSLYIRTQNGVENDAVEDFFDQQVEAPFAALSQRIKDEQNRFSELSGPEGAVICRFVASQTMRTLGHKQAIEEQAGKAVEGNVFIDVMLRKTWTLINSWLSNLPDLEFYTTLPDVCEQFITGDSPAVIMRFNANPIWVPADEPKADIIDLSDILKHPNHRFWLALSPYVGVAINSHGSGKSSLPPQFVEPRNVRFINDLVRCQSLIFTLAKSRESLG